MISFINQIILLIIVLGGIIAFIGNYVGKYIGKRRLTVFNLRPRYTATIITIISGILIAFSTAGILLLVSQDARTALLGLDRLKNEIGLKSRELAAANQSLRSVNQELAEAQKDLAAARRDVQTAREGQVLFRVGEVVSLSLIKGGPDKGKIETGLHKIIAAAEEDIRALGIKNDSDLIDVSEEDFNQAVYSLLNSANIYVVKLVALRNTLWGEYVPARIELAENKLIYSAGEEIGSRDIEGKLSAAAVEEEITILLQTLHQSARDAGLLPDASGSMGKVPYAQISDLAKKISSGRKDIALKVLAARDIYTIGPLEVKFKIVNK